MTRAESKLKKEKIANYIHSLNEPYTIAEISRHFDVSLNLVKQAIIEYGVKKQERSYNKPMKDRDAKIIKDYENGKTLQDIGDTYGISKQRVYQVLLREGKINHNKNRFKPHTKGDIVFSGLREYLNENELTDAEFSEVLSKKLGVGVTPTKLNSILQNYYYINYKTIVAILEITGLDFETCFNIDWEVNIWNNISENFLV